MLISGMTWPVSVGVGCPVGCPAAGRFVVVGMGMGSARRRRVLGRWRGGKGSAAGRDAMAAAGVAASKVCLRPSGRVALMAARVWRGVAAKLGNPAMASLRSPRLHILACRAANQASPAASGLWMMRGLWNRRSLIVMWGAESWGPSGWLRVHRFVPTFWAAATAARMRVGTPAAAELVVSNVDVMMASPMPRWSMPLVGSPGFVV